MVKENEMDDCTWYVNLMNFLDGKAKANAKLNRIEIEQLNRCIDKYDVADSVTELIHDIADANDCGRCETWQELVDALAELFKRGERVEI